MSGEASEALVEPKLPGYPELRRGKVRHIFDVGEGRLMLVASDRISAFDCILPTGIPGKGRWLTQVSRFWFGALESAAPHHLITADPEEMPAALREAARGMGGRAMLCRAVEIIPYECVVRGALAGSAYKEYMREGRVGEVALPPGLTLGAELPEPLFTPTTKAPSGHDEPIRFAEMVGVLGAELAEALRARSLAIFAEARALSAARGLVLCDTKFEFGRGPDGELVLADEVLTPDSSRYFLAAEHRPGEAVVPYDKQHVRDYLESLEWDKSPPAPPLPAEVVAETARRYQSILERLAGEAT